MLAEEILADGYIDGAEAMRIRREVFQGSVADTEEVELIFYLDANGGGDKAWAELFIETLSDFFVRKQFPPGILCQEDADYLVRRVASDGMASASVQLQFPPRTTRKPAPTGSGGPDGFAAGLVA